MIEELLALIRRDLRAGADTTVAQSNQRFFKQGEHFVSYGLKSAEVNKLTSKYLKQATGLSWNELLTLSESLWQSGYQEEVAIACHMTDRLGARSTSQDFDLYATWLDQYVRNWAMCDMFCNHTIAALVMKYPEHAERLLTWTRFTGNG